MMTFAATTIGLAVATHPFQVLFAVIALYHAGRSFLGSARGEPAQRSKTAIATFPLRGKGELANAA
jgi:hypothetical protein